MTWLEKRRARKAKKIEIRRVKKESRREKRGLKAQRRAARKEQRRQRPKKHRFRNMSIRMSFMVYVAVSAAAALLAVILVVSVLLEAQNDLYRHYEEELVEVERGVYISALTGDEETRQQEVLYGALAMLSIPVGIVLCLVAASFLFYKHKLQQPIAILQNASAEIARDNLNFHIAYDRRDEMGKLVASFETMRAALHASHSEMWRSMEERKRLNAAFSHDLRTPLTVLHGYTDLLNRHLDTLPPDMVKSTVEAMSGQIMRLERYVESMNALQRLEDMPIEPIPVDCGELAANIRGTAEIVCASAGKAARFDIALPSRSLLVDPSIVTQVYENLLSNAVRFAQSEVRVCAAAADGKLSIAVADDGHGFSLEALKRATDPFYSGGKTDGSHFGLGLNIASILCARHGGGLTVANGMDGGGRVEARFQEKPALR